jgi:hypothetical protein
MKMNNGISKSINKKTTLCYHFATPTSAYQVKTGRSVNTPGRSNGAGSIRKLLGHPKACIREINNQIPLTITTVFRKVTST